MKTLKTILTVIALLTTFQLSAATLALTDPQATICFTPGGECTDVIVRELALAKASVYIQAYSFTSAPIAKAVVDAFKRGVKVEIILDKSQRTERYSSATFLFNSGIPTYIDTKHAIAHNKIMIIDSRTLITGSFNFTKAAQEHNAENLLVLHDFSLATLYQDNWLKHRAHAQPYIRNGGL